MATLSSKGWGEPRITLLQVTVRQPHTPAKVMSMKAMEETETLIPAGQ